MQNLWSRVAQTRSCRCVSCIHHSAKALSRRTATSTARSQVTVGDLFSACFSSTLATAAVLDMRAKQKRREQWDRAIREVKEEDLAMERLSADVTVTRSVGKELPVQKPATKRPVKKQQPVQESTLEPPAQESLALETSMEEKVSTTKPGPAMEDQTTKEHTVQELPIESVALEHGLGPKSGFHLRRSRIRRVKVWESARMRTLLSWQAKWDGENWERPPSGYKVSMKQQLELLNHIVYNPVSKTETILAPGQLLVLRRTVASEATGKTITYDSKLLERKPKAEIHLVRVQEQISRLCGRLLATMKSMESIRPQNETAQNIAARAEIAEKISRLSSADTELPSYGFVDTERAASQLVALNSALSSTLQAPGVAPGVVIAKICYNLLVSPVPPDTTTYNILMLNLTNLGLGDLAQVVVEGFLDDCIFKPNEMTIAAMLNHYISRNDHAGFYRLIQLMRGVNGDMRIKRRRIYFLYHHQVVSWATRAKVIHRNGWLVEKAPRDQMVFHKLVVGTCMFNNVTRAIMFTRATISDGYCLTLGLLNTLVRACISKSDLKNARGLLRIILNTWASDEARNDGTRRLDISSHARYFIHMLMSFCGINLSDYWTIEEMTPWLLVLHKEEALRRFARAMQLESVAEDVMRTHTMILDTCVRLAPYIPALGEHNNSIPTTSMAPYQITPAGTLYSYLKKAHTYLSRRLDSENARQRQRRVREKEAAMLYLEGGNAEEELELERAKRRKVERRRGIEKALVAPDIVHCEDDFPLTNIPEVNRAATMEEGKDQLDAEASDEAARSTNLPVAKDSCLESKNPMPTLSLVALDSPRKASIAPFLDLRVAAAA